MTQFRIGISRAFRTVDGESAISDVDLSPLHDNPRIDVETLPDIGTGQLTHEVARDYDAVMLALERVDSGTFGDDSRLSLVSRYGVGYDTIDVPTCTRNNALLSITPDGVRRPVATITVAYLLALTLRMPEKDKLTRDVPDGWAKKTNYIGMGLVGRTLGAIGIGNIGAEVMRLLAPFDMRLIAHDPYVSEDFAKSLGVELVDLDTLFRESDVVTVHCPLGDETRGIVNAERLAMMKPTAYVINTSRGPTVDESALIDALQHGTIAGAGLDVFEQEPPDPNNPLLAMDNVILAPHSLCFTDQCMAGLGEGAVNACLQVMQGELPAKVVNTEVIESTGMQTRLADYRSTFLR